MTRFKGEPAFLNSLMDTEGDRPNRLPMTQSALNCPMISATWGAMSSPGGSTVGVCNPCPRNVLLPMSPTVQFTPLGNTRHPSK